MIIIKNTEFAYAPKGYDLFICTVSYEERSFYLLDNYREMLTKTNSLVLSTDNIGCFANAARRYAELEETLDTQSFPYKGSTQGFLYTLRSKIEQIQKNKGAITICVDYSSMPRTWYCSIPILLKDILRKTDVAYFWYAEGIYQGQQHQFPTAGTDAYNLFLGKPSLYAKDRTHVIGLGFDAIRTSGIIQKTDPDYLLLLKANDKERGDVLQKIDTANCEIIQRAARTTSLDISDFSFMLSKIREIVNERIQTDDVILIPDGPKPLVLAMSMVPLFNERTGITCIHVARNMTHFVPIKVTASAKVVGFTFTMDD